MNNLATTSAKSSSERGDSQVTDCIRWKASEIKNLHFGKISLTPNDKFLFTVYAKYIQMAQRACEELASELRCK